MQRMPWESTVGRQQVSHRTLELLVRGSGHSVVTPLGHREPKIPLAFV